MTLSFNLSILLHLSKSLFQRFGYQVVTAIFLVVFCNLILIQTARAAAEDESALEARIDQYCAAIGINRKNFNYTGSQVFSAISFEDLKNTYHQDINQLFATQIKLILNNQEGAEVLEQTCTDQGVSQKINKMAVTYELAQKGLCRFAVYQYALDQKLKQDNLVGEIIQQKKLTLQTETYRELQNYTDAINQDLILARLSLNQTLAAYDEMIDYYILHLRLQCIISDLEKFRLDLADFVGIFFNLDKYINAASDKFD